MEKQAASTAAGSTTQNTAARVTGTAADGGGELGRSPAEGLKPLLLDVAVPLGLYYLLHDALGVGIVASLALSSVLPAVRGGWSLLKKRTFNGLAGLILLVNLASLILSTVSGDPRLMLAKDSGVSSIVGLGILFSLAMGRPLMTAGVKPMVVKGDPRRAAAWERLATTSRFRRAERTFSLVWGVALVAECVVRVIGVYSLPVDTMVWLGNVIMACAMVLAFLVSGRFGAVPMVKMVEHEAAAAARTESPAPLPVPAEKLAEKPAEKIAA